ncbi:hypothetical protein D3C80_1475780 [compost metagenome]
MADRAVGEDQARAAQAFQRRVQAGIGRQHVQRHVVDLGQEVVRVDLIMHHQAGQRGAVIMQIAALQAQRLGRLQTRGPNHILVDALLDLFQELAFRRVEGVVEIEHPGPDVAQVGADLGARRQRRSAHA